MLEDAEQDLPMPELHANVRQAVGPEKYKVVSIRLRAAEFESFNEQARARGLTSSLALRIAARRIGGFLEIDQNVRQQLEEILAAIGDISNILRQLHSDYAASGRIDADSLMAQRVAFGEQFAQLDALLRSILNVSKRRSDGQRRLGEALR